MRLEFCTGNNISVERLERGRPILTKSVFIAELAVGGKTNDGQLVESKGTSDNPRGLFAIALEIKRRLGDGALKLGLHIKQQV